MTIFLFVLLGILFGGLTSLLFFQMDSTWKKSLTLGTGGSGFFGTFFGITYKLGIKSEIFAALLTYYVLFFILSAVLMFYGLCLYLNRQ